MDHPKIKITAGESGWNAQNQDNQNHNDSTSEHHNACKRESGQLHEPRTKYYDSHQIIPILAKHMGVRVTGNTDLISWIQKQTKICLGVGVGQWGVWDHVWGATFDARLIFNGMEAWLRSETCISENFQRYVASLKDGSCSRCPDLHEVGRVSRVTRTPW